MGWLVLAELRVGDLRPLPRSNEVMLVGFSKGRVLHVA